jgi:hypothetical protein
VARASRWGLLFFCAGVNLGVGDGVMKSDPVGFLVKQIVSMFVMVLWRSISVILRVPWKERTLGLPRL